MADWPVPMAGGCRCGAVRFEITRPPLLTMACHCTGCQRMTASAFSTSIAVPLAGFQVTQGMPEPGGLHAPGQGHQHCGWCKSWLYTELDPAMGFVNVRATQLDDATWFAPFVETFTSEALPWAKTPARHSFATFPEMEEYGPILAEFAAL